MTRKLCFALILLLSSVCLNAQEGMFGFINFNATLRLMPEYKEAEANLQKVQSDYRDELERSKREFERQYIEFMLEQDHLSASIVAKRQKELQLMMDNNAQFRDNVQLELEARRDELLMPLKEKLTKTIADVCKERNLDYVVDTGKGTYLYINDSKGVDISDDVYLLLGIEIKEPEKIVEGGQPVLNTQENENETEQ